MIKTLKPDRRSTLATIALVLFVGTIALPATSNADVANVFVPGNPIIAAEVNENFDSIDQRVVPFEPDLSGFGVSFSTDGNIKNVVVLKRVDDADGSIHYSIRSRYANSSAQISIDGVPTVRPFIANYAGVGTDSGGIISYISNYIDAPDTANYVVYNIEESEYDIGTLTKTVTADDIYSSDTCAGSIVLICYSEVRFNADDSLDYRYDWSWNRGLAGQISINGLTFNEIRTEARVGTSREFRIRAKGIGEILRRRRNFDGSITTSSVIYYYANGNTGGSLAGTPFDTGQPLDGLFF